MAPQSNLNSIDKVGIGDLDGDGEYDFVIKRPGGTIDPSFITRPSPDTFKFEAYKSDGTFMWRKACRNSERVATRRRGRQKTQGCQSATLG